MFLVKRDNSNKNFIIKGFITAIFLSAFIFLSYFQIEYKLLNTILALSAIYLLLIIPRKSLFIAGFLTGILWCYWMAVSLQYYELIYLTPILLAAIGLVFAVLFLLIGLFKSKFMRVLLIFAFTFIVPFGFNWLKLELIFIDTYFGTSKEDFALILVSMYMLIKLNKTKILFLLPLFFAYDNSSTYIINEPKTQIHMSQLYIKQDLKWKKENKSKIFKTNLSHIDKAIEDKKDLVVLPETAFPTVLNRNGDMLDFLKYKSTYIDILTGALYVEDNQVYNATYFISKGEVKIAKKVVLVPFGEEIPLPKYFVDLINDTFYGGASDYAKAKEATDFVINGEKFRNAICYEATTDKIFENLNDTKYMIVTSNNAWFTPSIEPTLQKLLMRYYANKYQVTIFHVVNGSENYIIRPKESKKFSLDFIKDLDFVKSFINL